MDKTQGHARIWSTSSFGGPPDTSPAELAALGEHLERCAPRNARLFAFRCAGDTLNELAASRTVTIVAVVALLGGIGALVS